MTTRNRIKHFKIAKEAIGVTVADLAYEHGCTVQHIYQVAKGLHRSARIESVIDDVILRGFAALKIEQKHIHKAA